MVGHINRSLAAAVLVASAMSLAGGASAQAWIGAMAGEMAAQEAAAAREKACLAGAPPPPKDVTKITAKIEQRMASYFALDSKSKPADIARVFDMKAKGVSFRDADGTVSPAELGARLDAPTPQLALSSVVVAGDLTTARAIWTTAPTDGSPPLAYAADFTGSIDSWFGASGWRIWHLVALPADQAPPAPGAYCHFDPEQAF